MNSFGVHAQTNNPRTQVDLSPGWPAMMYPVDFSIAMVFDPKVLEDTRVCVRAGFEVEGKPGVQSLRVQAGDHLACDTGVKAEGGDDGCQFVACMREDADPRIEAIAIQREASFL